MRATKTTILRKILLPILLVLVLQAGLLYGVVAYGGTLAQLRENTYGIFREKVDSRRDQTENEMVQRWSNLEETVERVLDETNVFLREQDLTVTEFLADRDQINLFLGDRASDVLYLLRKNSVNGAFLVLNERGDGKKSGLYFTDPDPDSNPSDYSDLQVERAPSSVTKQIGVAMGSNWMPQFRHTVAAQDFFCKPLQAAEEYTGIGYKDLGYWGRPIYRNGNGSRDPTRIITYSVPLIYQGVPMGVLGVDISLDYLAHGLPEKELGAGGFVLAISEDTVVYDTVVCSSAALEQRLPHNGKLHTWPYPKSEDYVYLRDGSKNLVAHLAPLHLYNTHTPFVSEQWALLGVVPEAELLRFVRQFRASLALACLVTFTLGILQIFLVSRRIALPISLLSGRVKQADPSQPILLPRLHIEEIDELSDSIEYLSTEVANSATKLSRILSMTDISIGAFEYGNPGDGQVFLTDRFFQILGGVPVGLAASGYLGAATFAATMQQVTAQAEEQTRVPQEDVYIFRFRHGQTPYWSKLKLVRGEQRTMGVVTDITREMLEKKRMEYDRDYDILTNLFNRRAFQTRMRRLMEDVPSLAISALIMMDLDNLKFVNDTYGHDLGDEYIRSAASALKKAAGVQALVARLSGDEFVIFIHGYGDRAPIRAICDDIQRELQNTNIVLPDGSKIPVRASAGLAWYPDDATTVEELTRYADFAMYMVKRVNKGCFTDFNIETYQRESYMLHGKEELNLILERGQVDYHFQPIFDAKTGEVFGYEALMRPDSETIKTPLELLSLARSQSKLQQVERLTLFRAMACFEALDVARTEKKIFLNSIPSQILTPAEIAEFMTRYAPLLSRIVVEITEEERGDSEITRCKQASIRRWNAALALDDFGVGYNGETALVELAPQYVKLDISIVKNISVDRNRHQLLDNLIAYSHERGIRIIAEGVEDPADLRTLIHAGVDYLQGYCLALPIAQPHAAYPDGARDILAANAQKTHATPL